MPCSRTSRRTGFQASLSQISQVDYFDNCSNNAATGRGNIAATPTIDTAPQPASVHITAYQRYSHHTRTPVLQYLRWRLISLKTAPFCSIVYIKGQMYSQTRTQDGCNFVTSATERSLRSLSFIMVALWNRADHYIFMLLFVLLSSFFPRLISAVADWMSAILPRMVWP